MKFVVKKSETKDTSEHGISKFTEYKLPFNNFSVGISEINGRYPETGYDVDTQIEATWYIESGEAIIFLNEVENNVEAGDMVFIPKGEKFWIDGKNLKLVVVSSPQWYSEQHKHIEQ